VSGASGGDFSDRDGDEVNRRYAVRLTRLARAEADAAREYFSLTAGEEIADEWQT